MGTLIALMIVPVAVACGAMHLINKSTVRRIAGEIQASDLPVGQRLGRHEASFSLGPEFVTYQDEGFELHREQRVVESYDETGRYVVVRLHGGKTIPIDKQTI